jgi:lysophospholipase L1-like esterase
MIRRFTLRFVVCVVGAMAIVICGSHSRADVPKSTKQPEKLHPTLVQVKDTPGLPRVLLIGDSVSMWYTLPVRKLLEGKANVHRPPVNCHHSRQVLAELDSYLGDKPWDVIHLNCGGHDITYRINGDGAATPPPEGKIVVPLDQYQANLRAIIKRLKQTKAKIIWAATTPMGEAYIKKGFRFEEDIVKYNAAAAEIMKEEGIPINDLYSLAKPYANKLLKDGVHFTNEGSDVLAKAVVEQIQKQLPTGTTVEKPLK